MDRRDVLKRTALFSGAAIATPLYSALLSGCSPKPSPELDFQPVIFTPEQYVLIQTVADTLLPGTDTPSASQTGAVRMIDQVVGEVYSPEDQEAYFKQFSLLENALGNDFVQASESERIESLKELESASGAEHDAWMHVKQQIIAMYLTTEEVGENQLNYLPVPGEYEPCIPLSETNGKAWAI